MRCASRHRDAVVDDVGRKFRRRLLQYVFNGAHHRTEFFADSTNDFIGPQFDRARKSRKMVATLHRHREFLFDGDRRADLNLYLLRHLVADAEVEGLFYVIRDGAVDAVAGAFDRGRCDDTTETNDRDVGRATTDVDNHMTLRLLDGDAGAYRGENWFLDHIRFPRAGFRRSFDDRSAFRRGHARGHRYHHFWSEEVPWAESFFDVVAEHRLCDFVVRDDAVFHRTVCDYLVGRSANHLLGIIADGKNAVVTLGYRDHGRLVEDYPFVWHKDEDRRRAEVDVQFGRERKYHGCAL